MNLSLSKSVIVLWTFLAVGGIGLMGEIVVEDRILKLILVKERVC